MKIPGIYMLVNKINNNRYIGQTINIPSRFSKHKTNVVKNFVICRAIHKYGWDNFHKIVLEYITFDSNNLACMKNILCDREQFWIDYFSKTHVLYNVAPVAGSTLGVPCSDAKKLKISLANTGKKHSKETRKIMSIAHRGKKFSNSWRKNMAIARTGKKMSEETKRKISEKAKLRVGRKHSQETKEKISNSNIGKHTISDNHKKKLLDARLCRREKVNIKKTEI